ncbi:MAG: glycosyltransferase [Bacteroidota bacterium]
MTVILAILGGCLFLYAAFVLLSSWFFYKQSTPAQPTSFPFLSVIVPARNEEKYLQLCFESILKQEYAGDFELILLDDHSEDASRHIAERLAADFPQLRIYTNPGVGKKAALAHGVSKARGEFIFQTDADCRLSPQWLSAMMACFDEKTAFVSGPLALDYGKHFFQALQALESMGLVVFGAGFLLAGKPNMANGANMAYRKSVFEELKGFEGVDHIASGDDELLLQKINLSGKYRLTFCKNPEAIVRTAAMSSWSTFKEQRIRWVSKARAYVDRFPNIIQGISYLAFLFFPLVFLASLWDPFYGKLLFWAFTAKLLVDLVLMYQAARFFHNLRILFWFLPLQILYIPYVLWIGTKALGPKSYSWKGRNVS